MPLDSYKVARAKLDAAEREGKDFVLWTDTNQKPVTPLGIDYVVHIPSKRDFTEFLFRFLKQRAEHLGLRNEGLNA